MAEKCMVSVPERPERADRSRVGKRKHALYGLLVTLAATTCAVPAPAAPFELPPLIQPASREHHVGKIIWMDLVTPDAEAAKRFYGGLFGWTFRDVSAPLAPYTVALLDGEPVAGLVQRAEPPGDRHQPAWLTFIAVKDVDAVTRLAVAHGGKLLSAPHSYPKRGRQAVLSDPDGAIFSVLASSSGDPPDVMAAPGDWIWSSLITRDPDKEAAFYQTLFGYEVFDSDSADDANPLVLSTDGYARASANLQPGDSAKRHPHWLNYVRVTDAAAAAARATQLGGRVLVEPRVDPQGARLAVVADPTGAPVGLLEWTEDASKGGAP